jgi:hypothetical protein
MGLGRTSGCNARSKASCSVGVSGRRVINQFSAWDQEFAFFSFKICFIVIKIFSICIYVHAIKQRDTGGFLTVIVSADQGSNKVSPSSPSLTIPLHHLLLSITVC